MSYACGFWVDLCTISCFTFPSLCTAYNNQIFYLPFFHWPYQTRSRNFRSLALSFHLHYRNFNVYNLNIYKKNCGYNRTKQSSLFSDTQLSPFWYNKQTLEYHIAHFTSHIDDWNSTASALDNFWNNRFAFHGLRAHFFFTEPLHCLLNSQKC